MSNAGRPNKPTRLKVLHGTDRSDRIPENEPKPKGVEKVPEPPSWMDYYAQKEWERTAPHLVETGLLTKIDISVYITYCQTFARMVRAEKKMMEDGMTFTTPNGHTQKRPEATISRDAKDKLLKYAKQLGLTPSARAGMEVDSGDDDKPTAEEILNGSPGN